MADYTSDEIQTVVEKVVRPNIRLQYGSLGNRDVQTTFSDLQDAVAGTFMLFPNSPFYVVYLGTMRLAELIAKERETLASLVEAIENLKRQTVEVSDLSLLANARISLQSLESAAASRSRSFQSIEDIPAFKRYDANLQRFIDQYGKNIKRQGEIVSTPQQSRAELAGLISELQTQHQEVVEYAAYLAAAVQDYDSMRLPSLVSAGVISKSRQLLAKRLTELESQTPEQRLAGLRDTMLDLMAGRAAVRGLGALKATTLFALIEGMGSVFADEDHPATPARLLSDKAGPYAIFPGENELFFQMDGSFSFVGLLPGSFLANLTSAAEPKNPETGVFGYVIDSTNDSLIINLYEPSGTTPITVELTNGSAVSALQICDDINALVDSTMIEAVPVIKRPRYIGTADMDDAAAPSVDFTLPAGAGNWEDYGVAVDDFLTVTSHAVPEVLGSWYQVVSLAGNQLTATWLSGEHGADSVAEIEVGTGRAVRIRIDEADYVNALNGRAGFGFPADANQTALNVLGFGLRTEIYCRGTLASTIAQELTTAYSSQQGGQPRLLVEPYFNSVLALHGRSDPDRPTRLVAYKLRGEASVDGGTDVTFTMAGAQEAGVLAGDRAVIRVTNTPEDMNVAGTVVLVTDTYITVTMDEAISAGDVTLEVGPAIDLQALLVVTSGLSDTKEYLDFVITGSENQDGSYTMTRGGQNLLIPFEFELEQPLLLNRAQGGLPQFFEVELGLYGLSFSSMDTTLATQVQVNSGLVP